MMYLVSSELFTVASHVFSRVLAPLSFNLFKLVVPPHVFAHVVAIILLIFLVLSHSQVDSDLSMRLVQRWGSCAQDREER